MDRWAIETIGIPSLVLMDNAGRAVAREVYKRVKSKKNPSVVIVCGTGNNAGDGFVAARYLFHYGLTPKIFLIGKPGRLKEDPLVYYRAAKNLSITIKAIAKADASFKKAIRSADVIVDAIFGVGLNRSIQEPYSGIIEAINQQGCYVVAVDIPSGLDGTTGKIYGACIKADLTVTFSFLKKGFFQRFGPSQCGRIGTVDIGIPLK